MNDLVLREDKDGVAIVTLNRPEVLNALSPLLFVQLRAHVDAIAATPEQVGCVILRGAGRSFSAGNDLKALQTGEVAPSEHFQAETIEALEAMPQPVIASVRGHCYTGGMELMLGCDLLIVSETAKICDTHGKWGMTPTWGMTQRLPRRVGLLKAKELMYTARVVEGAQAVEIGLANACVPDSELDEYTLTMANEIVGNSWHTLRGDKMLLQEGQRYNLQEGLAFEREKSPGGTEDTYERIKAFGQTS